MATTFDQWAQQNQGLATREPTPAYPGFTSGSTAQAEPLKRPAGTSAAQPQALPRATPSNAITSGFSNVANPFAPKPPASPMQTPGNNLTNPGYAEQAFELTQNRLLEDPYSQAQQNAVKGTSSGSAGENYLNQNLGTLQGPGQGDQYWNQVQGQFMDPFAGEQFGRDQAQAMSANGASGAFNDQAQGQYGDFTGYSGPQNAQGQYGASQASIGNGTQGQQNMADIASGYGANGQYQGQNLSAGQYNQTQQAFGDMPIANFDPFYDRARQLGVQSYNQGAAGRGVYGSSEALSGVGNVITDIEAQRANRSFDAEMQRTQEQRMRQQLLGEQARQGDLSELGAFNANMQGVSTYGNLNSQMGQLQNDSNRILGDQANSADSQALGAQNANISGLNALSSAANNADRNEIDRFDSRTNAMEDADRMQLDRTRTGADIARGVDDGNRADAQTDANIAQSAASTELERERTNANIASNASRDDLARLDSFNSNARGAEDSRQGRQKETIRASEAQQKIISDMWDSGMSDLFGGDQKAYEDYVQTQIAGPLQEIMNSDADEATKRAQIDALFESVGRTADRATD